MRNPSLFVVAAAFLVVGALASADPRGAPVAREPGFTVAGVEVRETDLVDINTQEKERLDDGSYNDRYIHRKPAGGMVLLVVRLEVVKTSDRDEEMIDPGAILLVDPESDAAPLVPFAWFEDPDWVTADVVIRLTDKQVVELAFEAPAAAANRLALRAGDLVLGRVGEFRPAI